MLLDWIAPPECPTEQAVVAQVTTLTGEALVAQPLVVRARVDRGKTARFRLELRIGENDEGSRSLESDSCEELAQATALIVSFDLQSRAKTAKGEQQLPSEERRAPAPATKPSHEPAPRRPSRVPLGDARTMRRGGPTPTPPKEAGFGVGSDAFLDAGSLSAGAWGAGVMAFVTQGRLRGEAGATLWPRTRSLATNTPGAGASLYLRTLGVRACFTALPALHIDACLHAEGGSARATGFGISRPTTSNGRWLAAFVGATARPFAWGPVSPRFTVELGAPLHYTAVTIDGVGEVYRPSPVLFRFGLGLETELF